MENPVAGEKPAVDRRLGPGLAATWAVQVVGTSAVFGVPVLAPVIAPEMGIDATWIGVYVGITYLTGQITGLVSGGLIDRFGAMRMSQVSALLAGLGILVLLPAQVWLAPVAALLMGCCYGPLNPTSSKILRGLASDRRQPFIFSLKQTGVPFAGVLVGSLMPGLSLLLGWRGAFGLFAAIALVVAFALQPIRESYDADRHRGGGRPHLEIMAPLRLALGTPPLRGLSLVGFSLAGSQICVSSFYVLYLTQVQGWTLVEAGHIYAVVQAGGIIGRLLWGAVAKQVLSPVVVLVGLSMLVGSLFVVVAAMAPDWPATVVVVLSLALGLCSFGWNGVWLSEIADMSPAAQIGRATGGVQFVMFGGVTVLPPLFGVMVHRTESYVGPFVAVAVFVVMMGIYMVAIRRG